MIPTLRTAFSGPDLCKLEAHQVVDLLKGGGVSPRDLLDVAFGRLEAVEPAVNATPILCKDRAYASLDGLNVADTSAPGWLAGLPVGIRDLTPVEGVRTTFGTTAKAGSVSTESDPLALSGCRVYAVCSKRGMGAQGRRAEA